MSLLPVIEWSIEWSSLAMMGGVIGVPRLFEIREQQSRSLSLVDRDGLTIIALRLGSVITHQLVQELNDLIGNRYYDSAAEAPTCSDDSTGPPKAS